MILKLASSSLFRIITRNTRITDRESPVFRSQCGCLQIGFLNAAICSIFTAKVQKKKRKKKKKGENTRKRSVSAKSLVKCKGHGDVVAWKNSLAAGIAMLV